jgi:elongation factor P
MISTGELKKGVVIELEGDLWQILDYHHIKMGRGSAQVRIKFRNVRKQSIVEKTFQAQFLFSEGDDYTFMDTETYDQFVITAEQLGDAKNYIKDSLQLDRVSYEGETLGVELPINLDLTVTETDPGFAGDTATGTRKPATLETGLVVQVPLFVSVGDVIRVDTRTGEYQTRV